MMQRKHVRSSVEAYKTLEWMIIGSFFGWLTWCIFYGERIPESDGLGYDGVLYSIIVQHFSELVFHHQLSIYSLQRIIPSGIIYSISRLLNISLSQSNMAFIFSIYNTFILVLSVFVWNRIANHMRWTPQVRLISFSGLFLNFAILKMNTYCPVLTDTTAFVCGLLMLYFFLIDKKYCVLLTTIVGAFIFPTLMYVGLVLFVFPNTQKINTNTHLPSFPQHSLASLSITLLKAIMMIGVAWMIYRTMGGGDGFPLGRYSVFPVLYISIFALFTYFFLAMYPIYNRHQHIFLRLLILAANFRLLIAILTMVSVRAFIYSLSNGTPGPLTPLNFIQTIFLSSLAYPAIFIVSHVIYFGPIVCLLIYFWNDVMNYLKKRANGLFVVTACYIVLAIDAESRQIINFLPIAVIVLAEVLNSKLLTRSFTYLFILLSLVLSRVWLPLAHGWNSLSTNPPQITLEFPMQWYFMNFGPWMSHRMYAIFLVVTIAMLSIICLLAKNSIRPTQQRTIESS